MGFAALNPSYTESDHMKRKRTRRAASAKSHHAVFHQFAEGLARVIHRRRPVARVRAVEP